MDYNEVNFKKTASANVTRRIGAAFRCGKEPVTSCCDIRSRILINLEKKNENESLGQLTNLE